MTPDQLLACHDAGRLWPDHASAAAFPDLDCAYRAALAVRALRVARGERPRGYKVGFTNRAIWPIYQVFAPIWGTVWDSTLVCCDGRGQLSLANTCQPRLEPEIVFGIAATPPADASLETLFACIDWVAPGFEVVQSHCADWKFTAAETVMDGALHARLLVGRPTPARTFAPAGEALDNLFAATRVRLYCGETLQDEGTGIHVLDGPLHALLHFVRELRQCPGAPALQAGEVVTTGTWTDAWPVQAGQRWRSDFDAPLRGLQIEFL